MAPSSRRKTTIRQSLAVLGIESLHQFQDHGTRDDEFNAVIKKHYFRAVLQHHPDKGGNDLDLFRTIQTSFELLRDLHHGANRQQHQHQQQQEQQRATRGGSTTRPDDWRFADCFPFTRSSPKKTTTRTTGSATNQKHRPSQEEEDKENENDDDDDEPEFNMDSYDVHFATMGTPSWEYYQEAAEEDLPLYRVELARSNRSKCTQLKGKFANCRSKNDTTTSTQPHVAPSLRSNTVSTTAIASTDALAIGTDWNIIGKGEIRIGWMNGQSGTYGGWVHLRCWRVPFKIWLGVPDPDECTDPQIFERALSSMNDVLLSGFPELDQCGKDKIVRHVMNKQNWARRTAPRKSASAVSTSLPSLSSLSSPPLSNAPQGSLPLPMETSSSSAIVMTHSQRFIVPVPGKDGASPADVFRDKTFVLTGIFPEIGGGKGLSLGKAKTKAMIVSFGGRVTSAVSGKTNVLVVGKEPGMSKVSKARAADHVVMVSLKDLKDGLDSGCRRLEDFSAWSREEPMLIQNFSNGYYGSGLALQASKKDLAVAQGIIALAKKRGDAKRGASNRLALKEELMAKVESEDMVSHGTTRVNALQGLRKRKSTSAQTTTTAATAKKKLEKDSRSAAIVLARPTKRGRKQSEFHVTCDECGTDCTMRSWFYPSSEQDYCDKCHTKQQANENDVEAVLQSKGNGKKANLR